MEIKNVSINLHLKWFCNRIHRLIRRADTRGSADIIDSM